MFWWMELDVFSLECSNVSSSEFWDVYRFRMALGSPSFNVQGCIPVFMENYDVSFTGSCWLLGGAWFQCRCGDF